MKFPLLHLVLQQPASTHGKIETNCLIDTGCNLPLIIPDSLAKKLDLKLLEEDTKIVTANSHNIQAKRARLTIVVNTLDKIYKIPCMALILEENRPIIGTPVLDIICRKTDTRFVMDFKKLVISFE